MPQCCELAADSAYQAWLNRAAAVDSPIMLQNLAMTLLSSIGSSEMLRSPGNTTRVAFLPVYNQQFKWGAFKPVKCEACGTDRCLTIVTANAMFFLMRVLFTTATRIRRIDVEGERTHISVGRHVLPVHVAELELAMSAYRGEFDQAAPPTLDAAAELFFREATPEARSVVWNLYSAAVSWLIFHELGHALDADMRRIVGLGANPRAIMFLDSQGLALSPARRTWWLEEYSADVQASTRLMNAIAGHAIHMGVPPERAKAAAIDLGWGGAILALQAFSLPETYEAGLAAVRRGAHLSAFVRHPPMHFRQACLHWASRSYGVINQETLDLLIDIMSQTFQAFAEKHPIPE